MDMPELDEMLKYCKFQKSLMNLRINSSRGSFLGIGTRGATKPTIQTDQEQKRLAEREQKLAKKTAAAEMIAQDKK